MAAWVGVTLGSATSTPRVAPGGELATVRQGRLWKSWGRLTSVTPILNGGGTQLIATEGSRIGPGGQSVSAGYLAYYFYEATLAAHSSSPSKSWD